MKNLRILSIEKDAGSITPSGDFRLKIRFEITGTDGADESKVLFAGHYRTAGSPAHEPGTPIFSDKMHIPEETELQAIIPFDSGPIPNGAEVSIWGLVDTDFKPYLRY